MYRITIFIDGTYFYSDELTSEHEAMDVINSAEYKNLLVTRLEYRADSDAEWKAVYGG